MNKTLRRKISEVFLSYKIEKNLNKDQIIDHIFTTSHFKVQKWGVLTDSYDGKFPSDHFPVLSELKMNY